MSQAADPTAKRQKKDKAVVTEVVHMELLSSDDEAEQNKTIEDGASGRKHESNIAGFRVTTRPKPIKGKRDQVDLTGDDSTEE